MLLSTKIATPSSGPLSFSVFTALKRAMWFAWPDTPYKSNVTTCDIKEGNQSTNEGFYIMQGVGGGG